VLCRTIQLHRLCERHLLIVLWFRHLDRKGRIAIGFRPLMICLSIVSARSTKKTLMKKLQKKEYINGRAVCYSIVLQNLTLSVYKRWRMIIFRTCGLDTYLLFPLPTPFSKSQQPPFILTRLILPLLCY